MMQEGEVALDALVLGGRNSSTLVSSRETRQTDSESAHLNPLLSTSVIPSLCRSLGRAIFKVIQWVYLLETC